MAIHPETAQVFLVPEVNVNSGHLGVSGRADLADLIHKPGGPASYSDTAVQEQIERITDGERNAKVQALRTTVKTAINRLT